MHELDESAADVSPTDTNITCDTKQTEPKPMEIVQASCEAVLDAFIALKLINMPHFLDSVDIDEFKKKNACKQ